MKLIKINTDHYVVVDDSQIKDGDWYYDFIYNKIDKCNLYIGKHDTCKKITHSTQPLGIGWQQEVIELSLQEVKELIGEVDVEKKAEEKYTKKDFAPGEILIRKIAWMNGYNQALEDNKEKKYTEEDMRKAFDAARRCITMPIGGAKHQYYDEYSVSDFDEYKREILSAHTPTEWEIQIVDGKLKLK